MTTAIDRARATREKAQWAHVARAWCDYGPAGPGQRPHPYEPRQARMPAWVRRRLGGAAMAAVSLIGVAALAGAIGAP